jgi:hypothetical protein
VIWFSEVQKAQNHKSNHKFWKGFQIKSNHEQVILNHQIKSSNQILQYLGTEYRRQTVRRKLVESGHNALKSGSKGDGEMEEEVSLAEKGKHITKSFEAHS